MAPVTQQVPQVETLIKDARSLERVGSKVRVIWEESGAFTQALLQWNARPKVFSITQVFADEMQRRRGLRAYGVRAVQRRHSKINQLSTGLKTLEPRFNEAAKDLEVANPAAA